MSAPADRPPPPSWLRRNVVVVACLVVAVVALAYAAVVVTKAIGRPALTAEDAGPTSDGPYGSATPTAGPTTVGPTASATPSATSLPPTRRTSAAPPARTGFPGASNTGVPRGTTLSNYSGPCTITAANTVINAKLVRCKLFIKAKNVVIRKSKVMGPIENRGSASIRIEDSEVDAGRAYEAAVGYENVTVHRSNIHGAETSVNCHTNCLIKDSWLHGQYIPPDEDWHLDAFLSNGGSNVTLIHNTLACDAEETSNGGGCSANAAIFGDFAANSYYTFDRNLFVASEEMPYCSYAGSQSNKPYGLQVHHIVYTNNVFQRGRNGKCGYYGAITSFDESRAGNVWRNNVWDDGTPIQSAH